MRLMLELYLKIGMTRRELTPGPQDVMTPPRTNDRRQPTIDRIDTRHTVKWNPKKIDMYE